ncbi:MULTISPECIES: AEC family transporter [unclassified Novosphingobium]|uniref:AEC family transporter n=1 Tax=unclassified Novosphingobium TaxID=2644732 RepID=UPI00086F7E81|nr:MULTISPECIES: AEC family transporter [unclassified Novosphingobium]MBN9145864.1 AEC family transporter [Novosphingobium sp.]MDR6710058.1 putative permease [Novosphingobium sp. 1748]ODU81243.1 MAG: transporter [Novosphingobium sp. SCN 63-17]OJX95939.1 MAG: transporter [Novosphingobium sp. 63-713]
MLAILGITLPIFALILAGWGARRIGMMGPMASGEINRYVVNLALPALLFDIVANAKIATIWQPAFMAVFALGGAAVFALALGVSMSRGRPLADAAIDGLNAGYANTGFIGFPLLLAVLGPSSLAPTLIASILTVCVLFALALVLLEIGLQAQAHPLHMARKVALSLARNPLLVAPALGVVVLVSGFGVPAPVNAFLKLLGGSASPCALVGLGLFLAEKREESAPLSAIGALTLAKLILHPALTWFLATEVFHLTPGLTHAAVLLAALPTGTGPFMVAEYYRREAALTSATILITTIASLGSLMVWMALM